MATKNDITGDALISRVPSQTYKDNYDRIFRKKKDAEQTEQQGEAPSVQGEEFAVRSVREGSS